MTSPNSLLLGEEKQDTGFKIFVECRMKGAMRIVQISKSELENQVNGKKWDQGRKRTAEEIVLKM